MASALVYLNRRGWPLRLAGLAMVLAALANPTLNTDEREQLTDIVAVIVDESASQNIGERRAQTEQALLREVTRRIAAYGQHRNCVWAAQSLAIHQTQTAPVFSRPSPKPREVNST